MCLGGTSKARTVAQVKYDGDGSSVIKNALNTACRSPTRYQPLLRTQLNSCPFRNRFPECKSVDDFLGMAKRHEVPVKNRPCFKKAYSKALATATGCSTRAARRARHGGRLDNLLRE